MKRVVALYRSPAYSPSRHLQNDRAILDEVIGQLLARGGWTVDRATEQDVAAGYLPDGDVYLNMCQGPHASSRLQELLPPGVPCINTPGAVLACHRHRMAPRLLDRGVAFPPTVFLSTTGSPEPVSAGWLAADSRDPVWVKRGDVHAQTAEDVVAVSVAEIPTALSRFAGRGIGRVALQAHVPGPVVKFYGVMDREYFHWYPVDGPGVAGAEAYTEALHDLAERAARALGLAVYGGDAVLALPDSPTLIDLNDWPSFAPVRSPAAAAIADHAHRRALTDRYSCSNQ
ncbi:MAG: hypothetical protein ACREL3_01430 [Gemmatimonadales bacterium]